MNPEALLATVLRTVFPPEAAKMVQEYLNPENIEKMKRDVQETKRIVDGIPAQLVEVVDLLDEMKDQIRALQAEVAALKAGG